MQRNEFLRLSRVTGNGENPQTELSSNQPLYDSTILKCVYLIAYGKGKNPNDVRIIEPGVMTLLLEPTSKIDSQEMNDFQKLFLPDVPLILMPLHYRNHWSLFYYRSEQINGSLWILFPTLLTTN